MDSDDRHKEEQEVPYAWRHPFRDFVNDAVLLFVLAILIGLLSSFFEEEWHLTHYLIIAVPLLLAGACIVIYRRSRQILP